VYGALSGLSAIATGGLLVATDSCEGCFEGDAQFWTGLAFVGGGVIGVASAAPMLVIGPAMVAHARREHAVALDVWITPLPQGLAIDARF
jgi:hypothetical protein